MDCVSLGHLRVLKLKAPYLKRRAVVAGDSENIKNVPAFFGSSCFWYLSVAFNSSEEETLGVGKMTKPNLPAKKEI